MIPLRAVKTSGKTAAVTWTLVGANVVIFLVQVLAHLVTGRDVLTASFGVQPNCYFRPSSCGLDWPVDGGLWWPLLGSMFLHGGLLHLGFNMLFLAVFGTEVEARLGWWRYLLCYIGCGVAAVLFHVITSPTSHAPVIGASGAIAGVLGIYFILLPKSWILTYIPPIFVIPIPAVIFLGLWFAGQVASAFGSLPWFSREQSDIAFWAHLGGFAAGVVIGWSIKPWWKSPSRQAGVDPLL